MNDVLQTLSQYTDQLKQDLPLTVGFILLLLSIHIVNWLLGYRLNILGIWPRKSFGWLGIPASPFLHANFGHLIFNALPLFIFSNLILLQGQKIYFMVSIYIIVIGGFLTWAFARKGIHIGASALIMGYLGYIVIGIYHQPSAMSVIVGVVCIYYFSGMFSNLFPAADKQVSWEGHMFGFIAGIATAYLT